MIKVLSLVATCMAVISFSGFAAEAPSTAAANPYEQNIVRLSKITVAPEYLDQYKAFAAEVGRVSDASVNFHFDATRSFHLKIGKIK